MFKMETNFNVQMFQRSSWSNCVDGLGTKTALSVNLLGGILRAATA